MLRSVRTGYVEMKVSQDYKKLKRWLRPRRGRTKRQPLTIQASPPNLKLDYIVKEKEKEIVKKSNT